MKNLNRFEYLQLAASLMPESSKSSDYDVLAHELFELAKAIQLEYEARYRQTASRFRYLQGRGGMEYEVCY